MGNGGRGKGRGRGRGGVHGKESCEAEISDISYGCEAMGWIVEGCCGSGVGRFRPADDVSAAMMMTKKWTKLLQTLKDIVANKEPQSEDCGNLDA